MTAQQFSLRWNNYLRHITYAFDSLRVDEDLVDVTLCCDNKKIRAHKILLSACSKYFKDIFKENPCQHPVIIFKNVKYDDLKAIIDFMYQGEVNVIQESLPSFLHTAELLSVQGLTDGNNYNQNPSLNLEENEKHNIDTNNSITNDATKIDNTLINNEKKDIDCTINLLEKPLKMELPDYIDVSEAIGENSTNNSLQQEIDEKINVNENIKFNNNITIDDIDDDLHEDCDDDDIDDIDDIDDDMDIENLNHHHNTHHDDDETNYVNKNFDINDFQQNNQRLFNKHNKTSSNNNNTNSNASSCSSTGVIDNASGRVFAATHSTDDNSKGVLRDAQLRFRCSICWKGFKHPMSLTLHRDMHSGKTKCPVCQRAFSRSYDMRTHLNKIHKITLTVDAKLNI